MFAKRRRTEEARQHHVLFPVGTADNVTTSFSDQEVSDRAVSSGAPGHRRENFVVHTTDSDMCDALSENTEISNTSARHTAQTGVSDLFFERPTVRAWFSGMSNVLPNITPGELRSRTLETSYSQQFSDTNFTAMSEEAKSPPKESNTSVYSKAELREMDANFAFIVPSKTSMKMIKEQAIQCMTAASEPTEPCGICELSCCQSKVTKVALTDDFISLMRRCLVVHPDADIPIEIKTQYDASNVDLRLKDLLIYRTAITKEGMNTYVNVCDVCLKHVESQKYTKPPVFAIANGNYVGHMPHEFAAMSRTDEQAVALVLPCVSLSVVTGGSCKTIKSHHYVVKNTEGSIVEMLPRDLTSRVRVAMVGNMTPAQVAACKKRYNLNVPLCSRVLRFLKMHNRGYHQVSSSICVSDTHTTRTSIIIDRTNSTGESTENDQIVTNIRDDSTYSAFGSVVEENRQHDIEDTWIGSSSFLSQHHRHNLMDVLVRKSNAYVPMSKWAVSVQMFPTLFPCGCGGPNEPRHTSISVRKWILRCLQVDGHRFETHYAFMLLAFDFLATQKARETLYVKMNIRRQALKAAAIPKSTIRDAIKYFNYMTVCRQKGIKPRPPSLDLQRIIDLRKGLYIPESTFFGSNTGRMRARHDLFGMMKRFGPLQVFFTVSPDSAGTYNIAIKTGSVTKKILDEVNTLLVPKRAERKAIAATHPVECARYFLRVMKTVIEVLLGWDPKLRAPKRGGGIFGVVRAFGAAAETQIAGDLHAHIAVWLHGFPTTSVDYRNIIDKDSCFRDRVTNLADTVLSTKPPSIIEEDQCPSCCEYGTLKAVVPGIDAFRRPAPGSMPPTTACCKACGTNFRDKDIIELSIQNLAHLQNRQVDSEVADFEKCRPPLEKMTGDLATSLLVRDVQVHYWNHCKSCFKATIRTPKASVCRFFKPEEVLLTPTSIENGYKLKLHRAIGCEYVNAYNPVVMETLKCHHDAQFVFNGSKDTAAYVAKYCFKNQNPVENHAALSLAAFAKAVNKTNMLPPETTLVDRGYRILGSMLYSVTNGQEVAATMAALYILNESPFWFSHKFVHVNLQAMLNKDNNSVEITVARQNTGDDQPTSKTVSAQTTLERYWRRDSSLENISFMEICEEYEHRIIQDKGSVPNSSLFGQQQFSRLDAPKIFVLCGEEIPDITTQLTKKQHDYYYTALLTLFKPHRRSTLLYSDESLLSNYRSFLEFGDTEHVGMLQQFEAQWQDYHCSQKRSDNSEDESLEEKLLRTRGSSKSSWVPEPSNHDTCMNRDVDPILDTIPDDFLDGNLISSPDTSTTKLCENAANTIIAFTNLTPTAMVVSRGYDAGRWVSTPAGFSSSSYTSQIIKRTEDEALFGTQEFIESFTTTRTRLERLEECYGPVPYQPPPLNPRWTPETLPAFPTIAMVSECFQLNFWQHVIFEVSARHLLYAYSIDISDAVGDSSLFQHCIDPYDVKPQLIAYLGGEAGTGKSTVVDALLTLGKCWGRDGSVETLAFTGAAAINVHGRTMHSARNLKLNGAEPNSAPSSEMKARFSRVVLVVIDEMSITHQALLGGTDTVSRSMSTNPHEFMGGKHVLLIGDFLQLPPVGGYSCYQVPDCTANRLCHAGYALYSNINFVVYLTRNMRARLDPVYAGILDNLRWGWISDKQLDLLNSRVQPEHSYDVPQTRTSSTFYRPIVVCTNRLRCAINNFMIFKVAEYRCVNVYECLARPSSRSNTIIENLSNANDDITNRVPIKLLFYIGMPVMLTRKHPKLVEADIVANGVIGMIVGMHPPPDRLASIEYSVNGIVIHRLLQHPEMLLIKIRGCCKLLVAGFPAGVIGLPPLHTCLQLKRIPNLAQASVTVDQFAVVPAFACTTEKLQGQTCHDGVVVTSLKRRKGSPKQTLYVALSRATSLSGLTLTERITRKYLENFRPDQATVNEMQRLIQMIRLPTYATAADIALFGQWKSRQHT